MNKNELGDMRNLNIKTVRRKALVDVENVKIDTSKNKQERMDDFICQIKNPYCYICDGVIVKVNFIGTGTLEEKLKNYFSAL